MAQFTAHKTVKNNFDTQWIAAYFLGVDTSTGSYPVVNQDGVSILLTSGEVPMTVCSTRTSLMTSS